MILDPVPTPEQILIEREKWQYLDKPGRSPAAAKMAWRCAIVTAFAASR